MVSRMNAHSGLKMRLPSGDVGVPGCKGRVRDRYGRSFRIAQSNDFGVELLCKSVDDTGAEACFWLGKDAIRSSASVVGDRESPIRSVRIERNGNLSIFSVFIECVLEGVYD